MCLLIKHLASNQPEGEYILRVLLEAWLGLDYRVAVHDRPCTRLTMKDDDGREPADRPCADDI